MPGQGREILSVQGVVVTCAQSRPQDEDTRGGSDVAEGIDGTVQPATTKP